MLKQNHTKWDEVNYWNQNSYGNAKRIKRWKIRTFNLVLALVIPVVYPIPIAVAINKLFVKKDFVWRY